MALINKLTAIADAIRGKTGKTEEMTLDQMATEIAGIEVGGGGDDSFWLGLISGDVTDLTTDKIVSTREYAFSNSRLVNVELPSLKTLGNRTFDACKKLKTVSLPEVDRLSDLSFNSCSALESIYVPNVTYIGRQALYGVGVVSLSFPKATSSGMSACSNCPNLQKVEFGQVTTVPSFAKDISLNCLIFRANGVCSLGSVSHLSGTPFESGGTGGTVYCPQALIEQYQQATNWSTLYAQGTCNFVAIEGSEYE